jgi:hypothetical protein
MGRIAVPAEFVARVRAQLAAVGTPLLEHGQPTYRTTLYACAWSPPEYELQTEPGPELPPYATWREYATYRAQSVDAFLAEHPDLDESDLDAEIPDPYAVEDAPESVTAGAYRRLEAFSVAGTYVCAETGEVLGEVEAIEGASPGNDYCGVTVSSPLVLSCLQRRLDELGAGVRIEVGSTE